MWLHGGLNLESLSFAVKYFLRSVQTFIKVWNLSQALGRSCSLFSILLVLRKLRPGIGPSSGLLVPALCSVSTRSRISGAGEAPSVGPQSTGPPPRHLRVRYNLDTWLISRLQQEKELVIDSSCYNNTAKELNLGESLKLFKNCHAFHRLLIFWDIKRNKVKGEKIQQKRQIVWRVSANVQTSNNSFSSQFVHLKRISLKPFLTPSGAQRILIFVHLSVQFKLALSAYSLGIFT